MFHTVKWLVFSRYKFLDMDRNIFSILCFNSRRYSYYHIVTFRRTYILDVWLQNRYSEIYFLNNNFQTCLTLLMLSKAIKAKLNKFLIKGYTTEYFGVLCCINMTLYWIFWAFFSLILVWFYCNKTRNKLYFIIADTAYNFSGPN